MAFQTRMVSWLLVTGLLVPAGCTFESKSSAQSGSLEAEANQPPVVELAIAQPDTALSQLSYTGTTRPVQQISLTSRVEGQLLTLLVDVGDAVSRGQAIARLDDSLLVTAVQEAEAEVAARQFDVDQAQSQLAEARTGVELARATLQQAEVDAKRLQDLAQSGAIAEQDAELAETDRRTAEQVLKSAEEQVRTREQAIASARQRVDSQQAIARQARERLTYARLDSPISGTVLSKAAEPGDIVQPGGTVLEIGDLSEVEVLIDVSDRDRPSIDVGQPVEVTLDAFPGQTFSGQVSRISPVADAAGRLIPVEITMPNPEDAIGSGLLARVHVDTGSRRAISIPESALDLRDAEQSNTSDRSVVFVVNGEGDRPALEERPVQLGQRQDNRIEILAGLESGETYVVESDRPLTAGQTVKRSLLSET
ncbi:MAG: efflux RND transporter periplasmic adaptor subunit [Elainellaceae cyanobacterium]